MHQFCCISFNMEQDMAHVQALLGMSMPTLDFKSKQVKLPAPAVLSCDRVHYHWHEVAV